MIDKIDNKKTLEISEENKIRVGEFLKDIRLRTNLSLAQLADISGIFASDIHKIERGEKNKINPFQLKVLGEALNIDYIQLYTMVGFLDSENISKNSATIITWYEEPHKSLWFKKSKKSDFHLLMEKIAITLDTNYSNKILIIEIKDLFLTELKYKEHDEKDFQVVGNIDLFAGHKGVEHAINKSTHYDLIPIYDQGELSDSTKYSYKYGREKCLKIHLENIKKNYDFIFICTSSLTMETVNSLVASDHVIIGYNNWEEETNIVSNLYDFKRKEMYLKLGKFHTLSTVKLEKTEFDSMLRNNRLCSMPGFLRVKSQINYDEKNGERKEDFYKIIANEILSWRELK